MELNPVRQMQNLKKIKFHEILKKKRKFPF